MEDINSIENIASRTTDPYYYHRFPYLYKLPKQPIILNNTIITNDSPYGATVKTKNRISRLEAHHIFFETTAIIALYFKLGGLRRSVGAIGGYHEGVESGETIQPSLIQNLDLVILKLQSCNDPFQIQAAFTLSKAYAIEDLELRTLEFFKLIEIAAKYYASNNYFNAQVATQIFSHGKLFTPEIRSAWNSVLGTDTVNLMWGLKNIRNKTIGHGGIRPDVSMFVNDPEDNYLKLKKFFVQFNDSVPDEEHYYETLEVDIELVARLLFCKICNIDPFYFRLPGWWFIPSNKLLSILSNEGMQEIALTYDDFDLYDRVFA